MESEFALASNMVRGMTEEGYTGPQIARELSEQGFSSHAAIRALVQHSFLIRTEKMEREKQSLFPPHQLMQAFSWGANRHLN